MRDASRTGVGLVFALSSAGCYGALGPKLGYSTKHGATAGWELNMGAFPYVGITSGHSYGLQKRGVSGHFGMLFGTLLAEKSDQLRAAGMLELSVVGGREDGAAFALRQQNFLLKEPMPRCGTGAGAVLGLRVGIGDADGMFVELTSQAGVLGDVCFSGFGGGRPLRDDGAIVLPGLAIVEEIGTTPSEATQCWIDDVRAEAASVTAFVRMAAELHAVGAPSALCRAALTAARDEMRHTALCARMTGTQLAVLPLERELERARWSGPSDAAREAIAREAWSDGCMGEAIAAAVAAAAAEACDGEASEVQAAIARDETAHAELAWAVLEWSWREGGPRVRDAIVELVLAEPSTTTRGPDQDRELLAARGRLDTASTAAVTEREITRARQRGGRLLTR